MPETGDTNKTIIVIIHIIIAVILIVACGLNLGILEKLRKYKRDECPKANKCVELGDRPATVVGITELSEKHKEKERIIKLDEPTYTDSTYSANLVMSIIIIIISFVFIGSSCLVLFYNNAILFDILQSKLFIGILCSLIIVWSFFFREAIESYGDDKYDIDIKLLLCTKLDDVKNITNDKDVKDEDVKVFFDNEDNKRHDITRPSTSTLEIACNVFCYISMAFSGLVLIFIINLYQKALRAKSTGRSTSSGPGNQSDIGSSGVTVNVNTDGVTTETPSVGNTVNTKSFTPAY